jgi:hypothetical protein
VLWSEFETEQDNEKPVNTEQEVPRREYTAEEKAAFLAK